MNTYLGSRSPGKIPRNGLSDRFLVVSVLATIFAMAVACKCLGSEIRVHDRIPQVNRLVVTLLEKKAT